jgi:hypothetical protein
MEPAEIRARLAPVRARLASRIRRSWARTYELSLDAWTRSAPDREWIAHHPNLVIAPAIVLAIFFLLRAGQAAVAATLIGAWFALARGISQAAADFRRRINETYSRAVSQLASDKLEERLGGIYTLENISMESSDDYWTVMENLTAFVRERTRRTERRVSACAYLLWEIAGRPDGRDKEFWDKAVAQETNGSQVAADIAAVLEVIKRRGEDRRALETRDERMIFDFRGAILRGADLGFAFLDGASFWRAHLEGAHLMHASLQGANFSYAYLQGANLWGADLEGAHLAEVHLEGADLAEVHLEGADLREAHLDGVKYLDEAYGDARTRLPDGVARPAHWPPYEPEPEAPDAA